MSFVECFPECAAWHLTVLDKQKGCITNRPAMSSETLRQQLHNILALDNVHVFIRPQLSNLIFLDLDDFSKSNKDLEELLQL